MLKDHDAYAIVAVRDPDRSRRFYRDTLGLEPIGDETDVLAVYKTGATRLVAYPSEFAGTNKANAVVWAVGDAFDGIVAALEAKNVAFDTSTEAAHMQRQGNVYSAGNLKFAWFKDPDGNILHINSMRRSE
ncbi:MAG: VOC family protein [Alphaproteobacteria bacterium]|nr:VOC family protein [Alphaproteobacteria bacterium]